MPEDKLDVAVLPNETIAAAWNDFSNGKITQAQYNAILDQQRAEISKTYPAYGIGGQGYVVPMLNVYNKDDQQNAKLYAQQEALKQQLAGKSILEATGEAGVYQASTFDASGNLRDASSPANNDVFTPSQRAFYDAQGNKLTASQAAATKTGQQFAAAGWDIGYGPGMIGPGIKADTTEREARIAARQNKVQAQTETQQPATKPVSPTPQTPTQPAVFLPPPQPVKVAPIDTILFPADDLLPVEIMADLIFENIGGQELINISRNDTINGQTVSYQPIKNISIVQQSYNPNNIVSIQQTADKIFAGFAIKFDSKIPNQGTGPGGSTIYRDTDTGDIVIEFVNIEGNEQIEIQFAINGTIYEADI